MVGLAALHHSVIQSALPLRKLDYSKPEVELRCTAGGVLSCQYRFTQSRVLLPDNERGGIRIDRHLVIFCETNNPPFPVRGIDYPHCCWVIATVKVGHFRHRIGQAVRERAISPTGHL
ncbi:hypothetical protein D3C72_1837670 [compost metagenome]